jgi:hypothetical protein
MNGLANLVVIGAMKCGTTSLHAYLGAHPQISMAPKELNFFVAELNWARGIDWYRAQFAADAPVRGDTSPEYTMHPTYPGVACRMHEVVPDARLIYLVRHPVERLLAHYRHMRASRDEDRPLEEALADLDDNRYLAPSRYAFQLDQYLAEFPADRILVVRQDDLLHRRRETLRRIFAFLEVAADFWNPRFQTEYHRSRDKRRSSGFGAKLEQLAVLQRLRRASPSLHWHLNRLLTLPVSQPEPEPELPPALRREILRRLAPEIDGLERFSGLDLSAWRS